VPIPRLFRQGHSTYAEDVSCCGNTRKERYVGSSVHTFGNCGLFMLFHSAAARSLLDNSARRLAFANRPFLLQMWP